jgi:hypothetical protein
VTAAFSSSAILLLAFTAASAEQPKAPDCFRGEVHVEPSRIGDFLIKLDSVPDKRDPRYALCRLQIFSSHGPVFQATDQTMRVDEISGKDINGDGEPEGVFEGYSTAAPGAASGAQGAHRWNYWIVSLGHQPGLLKELSNQTAIEFRANSEGHVDLRTGDGAFDYFDCLSHAETVFPTVFLRLRGRELQDVGPEHWEDYADQIAEARRRITAEELHQFRESPNQDEMCEGAPRATMPNVLAIVFANLYGGKAQEAWKALDEMWPPTDKERVRKLILEKRAEGILRYTRPLAPRQKRSDDRGPVGRSIVRSRQGDDLCLGEAGMLNLSAEQERRHFTMEGLLYRDRKRSDDSDAPTVTKHVTGRRHCFLPCCDRCTSWARVQNAPYMALRRWITGGSPPDP